MRLSLDTLASCPRRIVRPTYDVRSLKAGIVHLGIGAFARAHVALFIENSIAQSGGDWGVVAVSMRKPDIADALSGQDCLYTVETLQSEPAYRVSGAIRRALTLPRSINAVLDAMAEPAIHLITLTVTEKGYCLRGKELDWTHPDVVHDLASPDTPRSTVGVLVAGLSLRRARNAGPITIVSCDNVMENGKRLAACVETYSERTDRSLATWISANVAFPDTMVDCIVPASDAVARARVDAALGLHDAASVQREPFAQWVIQDRFAGPRPDWAKVGVEEVADVAEYHRLKLHVLNAAHSALAYLGLERGHAFVREAAADPVIMALVEHMIRNEVAPALADLDVAGYWKKTAQRFNNPMVDHRLTQIAQDGLAKLSQRIFPLLLDNLRDGRPFSKMAAVVGAWLRHEARMGDAVNPERETALAAIWREPRLRAAILGTTS